MSSEKTFIQKAINDYEVKHFLFTHLERAGVSAIQLQKTPVATRITLTVQRPGMVVGKRGTGIEELAEALKRYGIDNPKIEVIEIPVPSLDAKLMAEKIARQIEGRGNVKQAIRMTLREVMSAGAVGCEIRVAGKLVGKGGKAKVISMRQGFLKKSGDLIKLVREYKCTIYPPAGAIGISVRILPPDMALPDKIDISKAIAPEAKAVEAPAEAKADEPAGEKAEEKPKKRAVRKKKEEDGTEKKEE